MQGGQSVGLDGVKIFVHVFGCRSSLCEGEFIAGSLKSHGAEIVEDINAEFNAAVIITCSVTNEADKKCRQLVRRVRRAMSNEAILAVCGCWSQNLADSSAREMGINILAGSKGKSIIPEVLARKILSHDTTFQDLRTHDIFSPSEWEELTINYPVMHSRAFVKIQDGCDHFCTYCIIPFLRGRPVSRPRENIIAEIRRLIHNGCKEIVLTGIHLGKWGHEINSSLASLIREVSGIHGLERLRLGSLEPFSLDENLLNSLAECEVFCNHLHLPLQSGDDEILSAMRRGYAAKDFVKICDKAREKLGNELHISSDILVGFPGEDDDAFMNTLNVMKISGLGRVHVFPFSERRGTIAEKMTGKISHDVKISRTAQAIAFGRELYSGYVKNFIGHEVEVLIEKSELGKSFGHTRNYIETACYENVARNNIVRAKAVREVDCRLMCEIL